MAEGARTILLTAWGMYLVAIALPVHASGGNIRLVLATLLIAGATAWIALLGRWKWAPRLAIGWVAFALGLCLYQTIRRLAFMNEHDGLDSATQPSSPMAFLIGWITDWVCLGAPAVLLLFLLLSWLWLGRRQVSPGGFPVVAAAPPLNATDADNQTSAE